MIDIPMIGLGTWSLRGRTCYDVVRSALEVGYRHFDTATSYGNQAEIGRAIRDCSVDRGEIFLTTKLPGDNRGRERETIEQSLRELQMDYVDLWLIHWPPGDRATPSVWATVLEVADQGLARHAGVSNYRTDQLEEIIAATGRTPAVNQVKWSPFIHDPAREAENKERGIVLEGYSPFKTSDMHHPVLRELAEEAGVTPAQLILRWHLEHEIVAIPKSQNPERLKANLDIFDFKLSPEVVARMDALSRG